ncbi:hypothetical protein AMAG_20611 [Allomyces macrogynus ATCC 38327]|uniref:Uncharacterized protein n=1 Tax=Allomyces macrogynus (strain ATCC 38327) TaxID=578462 RepID=A0A0L0TDE6_ALLM3|nr:hypothetical protein AMAG_20611 [Allomyces macrogynus ATCC 38327]|eukprot:KNE72579.1 hypothetical protein AMAG_20611 [Allomyces macrogynus ATCC 38327]
MTEQWQALAAINLIPEALNQRPASTVENASARPKPTLAWKSVPTTIDQQQSDASRPAVSLHAHFPLFPPVPNVAPLHVPLQLWPSWSEPTMDPGESETRDLLPLAGPLPTMTPIPEPLPSSAHSMPLPNLAQSLPLPYRSSPALSALAGDEAPPVMAVGIVPTFPMGHDAGEVVVLFAVHVPITNLDAPVAVCEPIVLSADGTPQSVLHTLVMDPHLSAPSRTVLTNMIATLSHVMDAVRAAGVATILISSDRDWYSTLLTRRAEGTRGDVGNLGLRTTPAASDALVVLFAVRVPTTNPAALVAVCEPIVLSPDGTRQSY